MWCAELCSDHLLCCQFCVPHGLQCITQLEEERSSSRPPSTHTQHILTALLSPFTNSVMFSTRLNYEESMQDEEAVL